MLRRSLALIGLVLLLGSVWSCSGEDGAAGTAGPAGNDAAPNPISIMILGSDNQGSLDQLVLALFGDGGVNINTQIDTRTVDTSAPLLSDLTPYDVVVCYTQVDPATPLAIGDVLANYVDGGGKVLLLQGVFSNGFQLEGRIMTVGYSPFSAGPGAGSAVDRIFDPNSIAVPPHEIFYNLSISSFVFPTNASLSAPATQGTTTVLARYFNGHNAIALNANGTVIGLNVFPQNNNPEVMRLVGNACHVLTDAWN